MCRMRVVTQKLKQLQFDVDRNVPVKSNPRNLGELEALASHGRGTYMAAMDVVPRSLVTRCFTLRTIIGIPPIPNFWP